MPPEISAAAEDLEPTCLSGVEGLDEVLGGGFPRGCTYLIQGDPGSGKTTLALQVLLEAQKRGESGFYITLSETRGELEIVAKSHGWTLKGLPMLELSAIETLLRPESQTTVFHPAEMELAKVTRLLMDEVKKVRPSLIVFDSLSEFRLIAETALRYRRHLMSLKREFEQFRSTVLLLDDGMGPGGREDPHVLSLTHGVVDLEQFTPDYGTSRRRIRIRKLRGVKFRGGYHDYQIEKGGLCIFPRLAASTHKAEVVHDSVSSCIAELDELLGGGLDRGTTTLLLGSAGTGKSTLSLQYAAAMASRGDKGILFTFDETRSVMLHRAKALGIDLETHLKSGILTAEQIDSAELSPGEFAVRVRREVEKGAKLVVIDSLNGYLNAMPGEQYLNNQLHELSSYLNQRRVLTILVMAQHGLVGAAEAPVDLSYLADTVVHLRFFEALGEVKLALAVVKKRSGWHEKTIREFQLQTGKGIRVGPVIQAFQGLLSGTPEFHGSAQQILPAHGES
jgi:circadian clock protein KaiC